MTKIIVIGGKGTAVCIGEQIVHAQKNFSAPVEFLGWAIDDPTLGDSINGYPVLCKTRELVTRFPQPDVKFIFALYKPDKMRERVQLLKQLELEPSRMATFVHPLAVVLASARIGSGTVVLSHTTIHSNVTIGACAILCPHVTLEHDTQLGDCNFVAAGACIGSHVRIGNGTFVGLNSTVREGVTLGDFAFVGMGANVLQSVKADELVYGNPARVKP